MSTHTHRMRTSSVEPHWRTPRGLFEALNLEAAFTMDLAARIGDALCPYWLGPGSPLVGMASDAATPAWENALACSWMDASRTILHGSGVHWPVGFGNFPYSVMRYQETRDPAMLIEHWVEKAWSEARDGFTTYAVLPLSPQTKWWRAFVEGHQQNFGATEVRRLPHRIAFDLPDGSGPAPNTGNVNIAVVIFRPDPGYVGPWVTPHRYWTWKADWRQRNVREEQTDDA